MTRRNAEAGSGLTRGRAWRALLLSATLFPGAGQAYVGAWLRASCYALLTIGGLTWGMVGLGTRVWQEIERHPEVVGASLPEQWAMSRALAARVLGPERDAFAGPVAVVLGAYVASLADAGLLLGATAGRSREAAAEGAKGDAPPSRDVPAG